MAAEDAAEVAALREAEEVICCSPCYGPSVAALFRAVVLGRYSSVTCKKEEERRQNREREEILAERRASTEAKLKQQREAAAALEAIKRESQSKPPIRSIMPVPPPESPYKAVERTGSSVVERVPRAANWLLTKEESPKAEYYLKNQVRVCRENRRSFRDRVSGGGGSTNGR